MTEQGKYIYCMIRSSEDRGFGALGIGGQGDEVYTVSYKDQAAVVSDVPVQTFPISREHTMAHQRVMEAVMTEYTILPVRFSTIAEGKNGSTPEARIVEQVLERRYEEFEDLLDRMEDRMEVGVKALWRNMDTIFQELVQEKQEIKRLKANIVSSSSDGTKPNPHLHGTKVALGRLVKEALEGKKAKEERLLMNPLGRLSEEFKANKAFGDHMFANYSFLVAKERSQEFDAAVEDLTSQYGDRTKLKYIGPVPPCNFVEIVVTWDEE